MYYEEKIIDGVLHFKGHPKGEWRAFTPEQLTKMIQNLREERNDR